MLRIFISYRREESDIWAGRLADGLREHFPPEQVFQDIASIDPGADFRTVLDEALVKAAAVLVVIGPRWLLACDRNGQRRLESPADFVHQEVAESLRRPGVRVFPLLVSGADMPTEDDLPEPLKPLARRQAFELTVRHWANDVARLVQALKRVPGLGDIRAADHVSARQSAEQEAQRSAAEGRAAKDGVQRVAPNEEATKNADERTKNTAEEEALHKVEEETRHRAAEADARRNAAFAAREKVSTPKADQTIGPSVTGELRTERPKRPEMTTSIPKATSGTSIGDAGTPTLKSSWKLLAAIGAVGTVALLGYVSQRETLELPRTPAKLPPTAVVQGEQPGAPPSPSAVAPPAPTKEAPAPAPLPREDLSVSSFGGRYIQTSCRSILDANTKLEWFVGPDRNMTWDEAQSWISSLAVCGGVWQMPTTKQLATLYDAKVTAGTGFSIGGRSYPAHIDPIFNGIGGGSWVWSSEASDARTASSFNFNQNVKTEYAKDNTTYTTRAFAVRSTQ